jgi:predicted transcriptional regulator
MASTDEAKRNLAKAVNRLLTAQTCEGKIGKLIVAYREASGKLQREMASDLGISGAYLSDVENGRRGLSAELLSRLEGIVR